MIAGTQTQRRTMVRRASWLPLLLVFAVTGPVRAADDLGDMAFEELYMAQYSQRSMLDSRKPPKIRMAYLVLLSDGTAFQGWPKGGFAGKSREDLMKVKKKWVGDYTRTNDEIVIKWVNQRGDKSWTLARHPEGWKRSEHIIYTRAKELPPEQLDGRYSTSRNSMTGSTSALGNNPITANTGNNTFIFRKRDGTFAKRVGKDKGEGTFQIDGYKLTLKYSNGKEKTRTVYVWPAANHTVIGIDKNQWFLEFRTPSLSDKKR